MSLTQAEIDICNLAADRIGAAVFTLANQSTDVVGSFFVRQYEKIRDSLLRAGEWNFARSRETLSIIKTLDLGDSARPSAFVVGDIITGITSDTTAEIIDAVSDSEYVIAYISRRDEWNGWYGWHHRHPSLCSAYPNNCCTGTEPYPHNHNHIHNHCDWWNCGFASGETITNATVENVYNNGVRVLNGPVQVVNYDTSDSSQINCEVGYPILLPDRPAFGYELQYLLPEDFMRLISISDAHSLNCHGRDIFPSPCFHIEGNRLLTDYAPVNLLYVKKVTDTTLFDALFVDALVLRLALAALSAVAGTKTSDLRAELKEELRYAEAKARCVGLQETNTTGHFDVSMARYRS